MGGDGGALRSEGPHQTRDRAPAGGTAATPIGETTVTESNKPEGTAGQAGDMAEKLKQKAGVVAHEVREKAGPLASQAGERAAEVAQKAGVVASHGVEAAAGGLKSATGGKGAEQIDKVSGFLRKVLNRGGSAQPTTTASPGTQPPTTQSPTTSPAGAPPVVEQPGE